MSSELLLQYREQPEVAWGQVGAVGLVVQNLDPLLTHQGRGDLRLVGTGIVKEKVGLLDSDGWALLMDFSCNFRGHNLGILEGSDFLFLRQNVKCHEALGVEKNKK